MDLGFLDENGLGGVDLVMRLAMATILGGAIGIERERRERAAGFRTHALVCVASALMMIVSTYGFPTAFGEVLDPSRIAAQVVSGIGFLGAGVIIFRKNTVRGLTTAASVWGVSGVGLAVGGGMYVAGTFGALFMLLIQAGLRPLERRLFAHHSRRHRLLIHVAHGRNLFDDIQQVVVKCPGLRLLTIDFDVDEDRELDIIELTIEVPRIDDVVTVIREFRKMEGVQHLAWHHGSSQLRRRERSGIQLMDEDDEEM